MEIVKRKPKWLEVRMSAGEYKELRRWGLLKGGMRFPAGGVRPHTRPVVKMTSQAYAEFGQWMSEKRGLEEDKG